MSDQPYQIYRTCEVPGNDEFVLPEYHLNGSGRHLVKVLREAVVALTQARKAMAQCRPHGRDYYTYLEGDIALAKAREQHSSMESQIEAVTDTLTCVALDAQTQLRYVGD